MTARRHPKHWKHEIVRERDLGEFKDIPGTGGLYRISKDGVVISQRLRSLPEGYWIVLKTNKSRVARPFNRVSLFFDGETKAKMCHISRLMLEAWVGPPPTKKSVAAHRNGVTDDDRLENLMWADHQDVTYARICRGSWAHGDRAGAARLSKEQVEAARMIVIEHGVSANMLATAMGVPNTRVREWLTKSWDTSKWDGLENPLNPTDATG